MPDTEAIEGLADPSHVPGDRWGPGRPPEGGGSTPLAVASRRTATSLEAYGSSGGIAMPTTTGSYRLQSEG